MPYIKKKDRERIDTDGVFSALEPGELNYFITTSLINYLYRYGKPSYTDYNDVIGVLECCKLELYRKMIAKYEDQKCKENGEVYE